MGDIDVTFDFEGLDSEDLRNALSKELRSNPQFYPVTLKVDVPYAEEVEYGTSPESDKKNSSSVMGGYSDPGAVYHKLIDWAKSKSSEFKAANNLVTESDYRRFAYHIIIKHKEYGMPAQPYFRPAIYSTLDSLDDDYFDSGYSLQDLFEEVRDRMIDILEFNDTWASRTLINNIYVSPADPDEVDRQASVSTLVNISRFDGVTTDDRTIEHYQNKDSSLTRRSTNKTYRKNEKKTKNPHRGYQPIHHNAHAPRRKKNGGKR